MTTAHMEHGEPMAMEVRGGSSTVEAIAGAAAVVLGIVGLAKVYPGYLAGVATIVVGVALWFEGAAIAARAARVFAQTRPAGAVGAALGDGMSAEFLGGAAGTVLGLLALLSVAPEVLVPIAVIVFGASILIGTGATTRLNAIALETTVGSEPAREVAREALWASTGAHALIGVGAAVLGILALVGLVPTVLSLVALLSVGAALVFSGSALTSRMAALLQA